jgi:ribosomal-protein-alanine N-acetyltransferase
MEKKIRISKIESHLLPQVFEIERLCFTSPFPEEYLRSLAESGSDSFLVGIEENRVVGYVSALVRGKDAHVASIAVLKDYRRRGVGRALMSELIKSLKLHHIRTVSLEVRNSNTSAIRFYEGLGFERVGVMPSYYEDGEDAVAFSMRL